METPSGHVSLADREFTIGEWHVMPNRLELRLGEQIRTLRNMEMEVLVALAEADGAVVLKDDLIHRVWEGRFVQGQVLTNTIFELRRAFQDKAKKPKIIATVNRKGYRLIPRVSLIPTHYPSREVGRSTPPTLADTIEAPSERPPRRRRGLAAILLLSVALAGAWLYSRNAEYHEQANLARRLVDQQMYEDASRAAARALEIRRTSEILDTGANLFDILGHKELALELIDESVERAKSDAERTKRERRRAQIQGDTEEELRLLQQGALLDPLDSFWPFKLGWFYITHDRDCTKSLRYYAHAHTLAKGEETANLLSYYGEALTACGEYGLAEEILSEYGALRPLSPEPDDMLGTLFARKGAYDRAKRHFEAAISRPGTYPPAELHFSLFLIHHHNFDDAAERLQEYEARMASGPNLDNQSAVALALLSLAEGLVTGDSSHFDRALEQATRAIERRNDGPRGYWIRGLVHVARKHLSDADADLDSLRAHLGPGDRSWHMEYAAHLEAEIAAARGDLERVAQATTQCEGIPTSDLFLSQCAPTIHNTLRSSPLPPAVGAPEPTNRTTRPAR